jgi:DNA-directed RNA polymerase specialized sigma24 family protein
MLLLEQRAQQSRERKMLLWLSWFHEHHSQSDEDTQLYDDALSHCLDCLTSDNRQLLERYYSGNGGDRIRNRQALAAELGIAINTLRNRALRLRDTLENCTARYLAKDWRRDKSAANTTDRKSTRA